MSRALLVLTSLLVLAAPARASTLAYDGTTQISYSSTAGEANRLTVTRSANEIVFTETSLNIVEAEGDCTGTGTPVVRCKVDRGGGVVVSGVNIDVGDQDDTVTGGDLGSTVGLGLTGGSGVDSLDASAVTAGTGLYGGAGDDTLIAGKGLFNYIRGDNGADTMSGGAVGSRTTYGMNINPGDDGTGDKVLGGPGMDIVEYDDRAAPVTVSADGVANDGEAGENDNIAPSVEGLEGGDKDDVLTASGQVDGSLSGYGGNDTLNGGPGDDTLFGGVGDDTLKGNDGDDLAASGDGGGFVIGGGGADVGADTISLGFGFDTVSYSTRTAAVSASLNGLADDGEAGEKDNLAADIEEIDGGAAGDTLTGTTAAQRLVGGPGNDTLDGGADADSVSGNDGDDTIAARDGAADTIACGLGTDTLTGDGIDLVSGCETANLTPVATPTATATPDTRAPAITLTGLATKPKFSAVAKGVGLTVAADEAVTETVDLLATARRATISAKFNLTLASKRFSLSAAPHKVKLKPSRKLLGKRRKLTLRVRVTATDAAGNQAVKTVTLKVRR